MSSARDDLEYRMAAAGAAFDPAPLLERRRAVRSLRFPTKTSPPDQLTTIERKDAVMSGNSENPKQDAIDTNAASSSQNPRQHARQWYHPRPRPRCAADLAGFNWTYWLFVACLVVLIFIP
jgi:hypothetical protein